MTMKLSNADMVTLLPPWMRGDDANAALGGAINQLFREPGARVKEPRVWDQIDNLLDAELDELAWELNIDWYSSSMSLDQKRATIKVAQQVMEKRGTKWAVEQLISAYFGTGYVEEWFENGGDPYTFKVKTTNPNIGDDGMANFMRQIDVAKSVRSHLDGVYYFEELEATILCSPTAKMHIFEYVRCGTKPRRANVGKIDQTIIEAQPAAKPHGFEYIHAGDGTPAGVYPGKAAVGKIKGDTIEVAPLSDAMQFEYATKAGDGTRSGTHPRAMAQGEIVNTITEAAGTTMVHCFAYTKCGTRRCGQK